MSCHWISVLSFPKCLIYRHTCIIYRYEWIEKTPTTRQAPGSKSIDGTFLWISPGSKIVDGALYGSVLIQNRRRCLLWTSPSSNIVDVAFYESVLDPKSQTLPFVDQAWIQICRRCLFMNKSWTLNCRRCLFMNQSWIQNRRRCLLWISPGSKVADVAFYESVLDPNV